MWPFHPTTVIMYVLLSAFWVCGRIALPGPLVAGWGHAAVVARELHPAYYFQGRAMRGAVQDPRALFPRCRGTQQQSSGSPSVRQLGLLSKKMWSSVSSQPAADTQREGKINLCSYKPPRVFSLPPDPPRHHNVVCPDTVGY